MELAWITDSHFWHFFFFSNKKLTFRSKNPETIFEMVVFYFDKNTHTLSLCLSFFCMLLWVCVLGFVLFFCVGFNWHLFLKMEEAIVVFYRNCRAETKKSLQRRKKIMWWDRGKVMVWRMSCVNGRWVWVWREESGLGRNEE